MAKKNGERIVLQVGLTEFESVTSCPPDKHANQLRYSPIIVVIVSYYQKNVKCFFQKSF
mgnify:CR=1 FL=1